MSLPRRLCPAHPEGGCPTQLITKLKVTMPDTEYGRAYYTLTQHRKDVAPYLRKALDVALYAMRDYSGCFAPCEMIHE